MVLTWGRGTHCIQLQQCSRDVGGQRHVVAHPALGEQDGMSSGCAKARSKHKKRKEPPLLDWVGSRWHYGDGGNGPRVSGLIIVTWHWTTGARVGYRGVEIGLLSSSWTQKHTSSWILGKEQILMSFRQLMPENHPHFTQVFTDHANSLNTDTHDSQRWQFLGRKSGIPDLIWKSHRFWLLIYSTWKRKVHFYFPSTVLFYWPTNIWTEKQLSTKQCDIRHLAQMSLCLSSISTAVSTWHNTL